MTLSSPTFTCSDQMGRIILSGMQELFDTKEISSVLDHAALANFDESSSNQEVDLSFERLPQLQASLERIFGTPAGRGLAIRSGRASFKHLLREFGKEMGMLDLEFRLLSLPARINFSNQALAALINKHTGLHAAVEMDDEYLYWTIEYNPDNAATYNERSVCHLVIGLLQETLSWTSGDRIYQMEETQCIDCNDPCCKIRIHKKPIS